MFLPYIKVKSIVNGLFQSSIPYTPIIQDGDSSPYFGTFEGQRYGTYDTSCCWDFAACELAETRLETLEKLGLIPKDTLDWLLRNGYKDSTGDYYLSREWVAILSGVKDAGNQEINFWNIVGGANVGLIPNSMLDYNPVNAYKWITKDQFNNDYFNIQKITGPMEALGNEFSKRFKVRAESMSGGYYNDISTMLLTYLKEGSLQIGIPVPQDGSWNQPLVNMPPNRLGADHSVELYKFVPGEEYPFYIYDSYEPHLKRLHKDYFIPVITRVSIQPVKPIITPIPILNQPTNWVKFWANIAAWLLGKPLPYKDVPIGSTLAK